jgi:PAS domain-containing protein
MAEFWSPLPTSYYNNCNFLRMGLGEFDRIGRNTFLINARQLHQEGNSLEMILIAMENITERKRAENELNISEVRYRRLFETAQDGIRIMKERVANMDGQLDIASQPGQGTRVVVRVPLPADNLFGASHE